MKRDLYNKWLEALKSGKYKQGTDLLNRGDAYCCLGVLCEVAGLHKEPDEYGNRYRAGDCGSSMFLPAPFAEEVGMNSSGGSLKGRWDKLSLSQINDRSASFKKVIRLLETKPLDYIKELT